jgi:membrane protease YdiL (CAAX protease family)
VTRDGTDEILLAVLLAVGGATVQRTPSHRLEVPANLGMAAAAVAIARAGGASWRDLGLEGSAVPAGLRTGAATLVGAAAAVALGAAVPATRGLFADERVARWTGRELAYHLVLRLPLATAVAEELLFRSALLGVERRRRPPAEAVAVTAVAFGLWHVLPALRHHELADRVGGRPASIGATVALTAVAGAGLTWLRLRSRSVVAPIVAHIGINMAGLLAARFASGPRRSRRR